MSDLWNILGPTLNNPQAGMQGSLNRANEGFERTLLAALEQWTTSSLSDGGSKSEQPYGLSFETLTMPLTLQLMNSLLQENPFQSGMQPGWGLGLDGARSIQINQFIAEEMVAGDGANANCGPASLAMALHGLGLRVGGRFDYTQAGQAVDLARKVMGLGAARDGIDALGQRSELEHNTYTNLDEIAHGARASGAQALKIPARALNIAQSLQTGAQVVVSGTFVGKQPLPWTGDRGKDNQSAPGGARAHIVLVSGFDPTSGQFTINDPARLAPLQVNAGALEQFMRGNAGALAIRRQGPGLSTNFGIPNIP